MRRSWTRNPSSDTVEFLSLRRGCGYRSAVPAAQQKKQKEIAKFRNELKKGDKIVTIGGIYGTVDEIREKYVIIVVDGDVKLRVDKSAIVKDMSDVPAK